MPSPETSRRNLEKARQGGQIKLRRCGDETTLIKLLVWQSCFDAMDAPQPSQRQLARQLGVSQPYVCKLKKQAVRRGWDALGRYGRRVTLDDLAEARRFTAKLREREPSLLAPAPQSRASAEPRYVTEEQRIAETWREVEEWKRRNLWRSDTRRRVSVPIPRGAWSPD